MSDQLPALKMGDSASGREEMLRLVLVACTAYAARDMRKAADALCAAEALAKRSGLFRDAAKLRKAIAILAQGGKPRLLVRGVDYLDGGR